MEITEQYIEFKIRQIKDRSEGRFDRRKDAEFYANRNGWEIVISTSGRFWVVCPGDSRWLFNNDITLPDSA